MKLSSTTQLPVPRGFVLLEVVLALAIDRDAPIGNQLVAMPPRTDTSGGEETV